MSKEARGLDVNIMGREFRVSCTEEERRDLLKAIDYLNTKMREIRETATTKVKPILNDQQFEKWLKTHPRPGAAPRAPGAPAAPGAKPAPAAPAK